MKTGRFSMGFAYLWLSNEETQGGESSGIANQQAFLEDYAQRNGFINVHHFTDDGVSGTTFDEVR